MFTPTLQAKTRTLKKGRCFRMVAGFTTTYAISTYHHYCCEFQSRSLRRVLDTTLCDKVCQSLEAGLWVFLGTAVFSTNKTDRHDITEILLKVALNTIILTLSYSVKYIVSILTHIRTNKITN